MFILRLSCFCPFSVSVATFVVTALFTEQCSAHPLCP
jgi:hypothetical protein